MLVGSFGSWEVRNTDVTPGHLASLTVVRENDLMVRQVDEEKILHRTVIEGKPEYNKMDTNLEISSSNKIFFGDTNSGITIKKYSLSIGNEAAPSMKIREHEININSASNGLSLTAGKINFKKSNLSVTSVSPRGIKLPFFSILMNKKEIRENCLSEGEGTLFYDPNKMRVYFCAGHTVDDKIQLFTLEVSNIELIS